MDALIMERAEALAKSIEDLNGVLKSLMKSVLEQFLGEDLIDRLSPEIALVEGSSRCGAAVGVDEIQHDVVAVPDVELVAIRRAVGVGVRTRGTRSIRERRRFEFEPP